MELELEQEDAEDDFGDMDELEVDEDEADVVAENDSLSGGNAGIGDESTLGTDDDDVGDGGNGNDGDGDDDDDDDQFELELDEGEVELGIEPSSTGEADDVYEDDDMSDEDLVESEGKDNGSDEDDAPLVRQNLGRKPDLGRQSNDVKPSSMTIKNEASSDEDDDLPLVSRQVAKVQTSASRLPKTANGAVNSVYDEYNSDDDMPLVHHAAVANGPLKDKRKLEEKSSRSAKPNQVNKKAKSKSKEEAKAQKVKPPLRKSADPAQKVSTRAKPRASTKSRTSKKNQSAEGVEGPVRKFELPGQRRETPGKSEPLRLFYETMYKERIDLGKPSELAETWMLHHGLLDPKLAAKVHSARIRTR
jgi:hypothetical protein